MTIFALSSGPGVLPGIAVVRISGEDTKNVIKSLTGKETYQFRE